MGLREEFALNHKFASQLIFTNEFEFFDKGILHDVMALEMVVRMAIPLLLLCLVGP